MPKKQSAPPVLEISAPYNFVPLADWVHIPEWSKQVSHDWPFEDGLCGQFQYTLITESPLLVGGHHETATKEKAGVVKPFQLSDGKYAIPGSSLKGMLRSVVEIAGFGRMRKVDDQTLSVRDLTRGALDIYRKPMAKSVAGWLSFDPEERHWKITPCDFVRVEHDDLATFSGDKWWRSVPQVPLAREKYKRWLEKGKSLHLSFSLMDTNDQSRDNDLRSRRAQSLSKGPLGTLVFTGQPAARVRNKKGTKHLEFIFFDAQKNKSLSVSPAAWQGFQQIYSESADWAWWKKKKQVPVFFLQDDSGEVASLGLSLMYRLPYKNTIHDAISHSSSKHLDEPGLDKGYDFSDLLFGSIHSNDQSSALRGRVSFSMATAKGAPELQPHPPTILNGPKPSYYPNYIKQPDPAILARNSRYKTLMDPDAEIRGFKRYPARPTDMQKVPELSSDQEKNCSVQAQLNTLPPGTTFSGHISFHNLKPEELGALLWSLTWENRSNLRHGLGMGKSFGFGQVRFEISEDESQLIPNNRQKPGSPLDHKSTQDLISEFTSHMEGSAHVHGGWKTSPQIKNLLSMADIESALHLPSKFKLRHMDLSANEGNEFLRAKNECLALKSYEKATNWNAREAKRKDKIRQQEEDQIEAQREAEDQRKKDEFDALSEDEKHLMVFSEALKNLPTSRPLTKDQYSELKRHIKKLFEAALEWGPENRLKAADSIEKAFSAYGWNPPGLRTKQRKKKEDSNRSLVEELRSL